MAPYGALSESGRSIRGFYPKEMVGPGRLELPTLRLSGVRSNHLSYGPMAARRPYVDLAVHALLGSRSHRLTYRPAVNGKRNEDGDTPHLDSVFERTNRPKPGGSSLERR